MYKHAPLASTSALDGVNKNLMVTYIEKGNSGSNQLPLKMVNSCL